MTKRTKPSIIGNLSNYDMDFDEDDINGSEGEDDYEPDYEDLAERKKEDEEWEAEHAWHGNYHYPNNDPRW